MLALVDLHVIYILYSYNFLGSNHTYLLPNDILLLGFHGFRYHQDEWSWDLDFCTLLLWDEIYSNHNTRARSPAISHVCFRQTISWYRCILACSKTFWIIVIRRAVSAVCINWLWYPMISLSAFSSVGIKRTAWDRSKLRKIISGKC